MNLQKTEEIKLKESKTAFAFGLTCPSKNATETVRELFNLKLNFMKQIKVNGYKETNISDVTTHNCHPDDFYNLHDDSFELFKGNQQLTDVKLNIEVRDDTVWKLQFVRGKKSLKLG